jgi:hypothetical protein
MKPIISPAIVTSIIFHLCTSFPSYKNVSGTEYADITIAPIETNVETTNYNISA